jgi:SAM-dependent methyltransferase
MKVFKKDVTVMHDKIICSKNTRMEDLDPIEEFKYNLEHLTNLFEKEHIDYYKIHKKFFNSVTMADTLRGNSKTSINLFYNNALNLSGIKSGVILDYGCSLGHNGPSLKDRGSFYYIGADHNLLSLLIGSLRFPELDSFYHVDSKSKDVLIELKDNSVDLIIMSLVNNYKNIENLLPAFRRVLKPGGYFYIESHESRGTPKYDEREFIVKYITEYFKIVELLPGKNCASTLDQLLEKETDTKFKYKISGCFKLK